MIKYRAVRISNVEEFLAGAIGGAVPTRPIWMLHSVVPSVIINAKVEQWLVILQSTDDFKPE